MFANAAAHLEPGGCFVVEVVVPQLRRLPPGETGRVFDDAARTTSASRRSTTPSVRSRGRTTGWSVDGRLVRHVRAVPVRVAVGARPDGPARRTAPPRPLGRLVARAVHVGEHEPGRRVRTCNDAAMTFDTAIADDDGTLTGPLRRPAQMLADQTYGGHTSVHDGDTAAAARPRRRAESKDPRTSARSTRSPCTCGGNGGSRPAASAPTS